MIDRDKIKKIVPRIFLPFISEIEYRLSSNDVDKNLFDEVSDNQKQWRDILKNSEEFIKRITPLQNKHVLFVTGYGLGSHFLTIEPILMMALFARGCKISSLYCNISLPACEFNIVGNNKPDMGSYRQGISKEKILFRCNKCKNNIENTYSMFPINLHPYNKYITSEDYNIAVEATKKVEFDNFKDFVYEGIKVGEEAWASILRATFRGVVDDNPLNRILYKRYLISGVLMARAAEKAYLDLKPDHILMIHGVYLTHGIAVKVARKLGIPCVVMGGGGIRKDTVVMCHNETYHHQLINEPNTLWENQTLSEENIEKVLNYTVKKRHSGGGVDYLSYHPNPIEDRKLIYKELNIDDSRPIVSIYTNVIWDAQIFYDSNVFNNIFDWLFSTIESLGKNEKVWVVVRIHPAERKSAFPTKQPMLDEINKQFKRLPDNVRIVTPESDISSYTLAQQSKVAIIYGTKMGLEIALMKIPLIICGETFSRNKGYGLDVTSRDQYFEILEKIQDYPSMNDDAYQRAIKYAHYFYFQKMIDMPFTSIKNANLNIKKLNFNTIEELLDHKSIELKTICEGIFNKTPIFFKSE